MKFLTITTLLTALVAASPIVENVERRNAPDPKQIKIKCMILLSSLIYRFRTHFTDTEQSDSLRWFRMPPRYC
jgi:hypothetical protein